MRIASDIHLLPADSRNIHLHRRSFQQPSHTRKTLDRTKIARLDARDRDSVGLTRPYKLP